MNIVQVIQDDLNKERRSGGSNIAMISTILSEIVNIGKSNGNRATTDSEAVGAIKKMVKNNKATIGMSNESQAEPYVRENEYLDKFLPQDVSKEEIEAYIKILVDQLDSPTMKDMGKIMGNLKAHFNGNYDGKMVSNMVRQALS